MKRMDGRKARMEHVVDVPQVEHPDDSHERLSAILSIVAGAPKLVQSQRLHMVQVQEPRRCRSLVKQRAGFLLVFAGPLVSP